MTEEESALLLYEEAMTFVYAAALRAAASLGLADSLARGPSTAAELAKECGTDAQALYRILRLLRSRGIVAQEEERFWLTEKGAALGRASSGILMFTDNLFWTTAQALAEGIREEQPPLEQLLGVSFADYFARDPRTEALFYEGMATVSAAENERVAQCCEFPPSGVVADIGGGNGAFLRTVLEQNPGLRGILLDRESVVAQGPWQAVAGDFRVTVPSADVYLLKRIVHNWDDEQSVRILGNCRRAMSRGGKVLLVDAIIPEDDRPHQSTAMDLMMLSIRTGQERTTAELRGLFQAAGLDLVRVIPTSTVMSIAEGVAQ
jgi:predicted transcriptional regulator